MDERETHMAGVLLHGFQDYPDCNPYTCIPPHNDVRLLSECGAGVCSATPTLLLDLFVFLRCLGPIRLVPPLAWPGLPSHQLAPIYWVWHMITCTHLSTLSTFRLHQVTAWLLLLEERWLGHTTGRPRCLHPGEGGEVVTCYYYIITV